MMLLVYILIAVLLEVLYTQISARCFEFFTSYFILRKGGVKVPITPLMLYLTIAFCLFTFFHVLIIVFTLVTLE